jgi:hypothetical protein
MQNGRMRQRDYGTTDYKTNEVCRPTAARKRRLAMFRPAGAKAQIACAEGVGKTFWLDSDAKQQGQVRISVPGRGAV